jgi:hypothetical protein
MNISWKKKFWWCAFALGLGGVMLLLIVVAEELSSRNKIWYITIWFGCSIITAVISGFRLRFLYRIDPKRAPGSFQVSLQNLIVAVLFSGLLMAIFQWLWPKQLSRSGAFLVPLSGLVFVVGLACATRRGFKDELLRYLYGFGFLLFVIGVLATGGLVGLLICEELIDGPRGISTILNDLIFNFHTQFVNVFRGCLLCLPVGYALCRLSIRFARVGALSVATTKSDHKKNNDPKKD